MTEDDIQGRSELGRALAALRRRVTKQCQECGQPFTGLAFQVYCSRRCQRRAYARAYYEEHRQDILARQRQRRQRRKKDQLQDDSSETPPSEN